MSEDDRVTAIGLFNYAHSYASSAVALTQSNIQATHPDSPIRFLHSHAIELYLKSYLRLNGVKAHELRKRRLGHDMHALRTKAEGYGFKLHEAQADQIDLLREAVQDRYIQEGVRTVLLNDTLYSLCKHLHDAFGKEVYASAGLTRDPIELPKP